MSDPRDYNVEITGADAPQSPRTAVRGNQSSATESRRPYLSVHFACCGVYQRLYRSADGITYQGRCPRCSQPVRFVVGDGGTSARSFVVR